ILPRYCVARRERVYAMKKSHTINQAKQLKKRLFTRETRDLWVSKAPISGTSSSGYITPRYYRGVTVNLAR
ncbi:MAG: hypothetical protein ACK4PR_01015, partial [Gammaproteobacteria bacterium]